MTTAVLAQPIPAPPKPKDIDALFLRLCSEYRDFRMERTAHGEIVIMSPLGTGFGEREARLLGQLYVWVEATRLGHSFSSSTGYTLPSGAIRSPDASWIASERWQAIPEAEREQGFAHICPDFVAELRSPTDRLETVREKMREYIEQGCKLGWLIDPEHQRVEVYRPGQAVEVLERPEQVSADPLMPGFALRLKGILFI